MLNQKLQKKQQSQEEDILTSLMVVGNVQSAKTTTSRVENNATDARKKRQMRTLKENQSTWHWLNFKRRSKELKDKTKILQSRARKILKN